MASSTNTTTTKPIPKATTSASNNHNDNSGNTSATISNGMKRWQGKRRGKSLDIGGSFGFGSDLRVLTQLQQAANSHHQPPLTAPHGKQHPKSRPSRRSWSFSPANSNSNTSLDSVSGASASASASASPSGSTKKKPTPKVKNKAKAKAKALQQKQSEEQLVDKTTDLVACKSNLQCPAWLTETAPFNDTRFPLTFRLSQEISYFVAYNARIVQEARSRVNRVVQDISKCVQQVCPGVGVVCFGSFVSGLWLPSSDIDLVVTEMERNDKGTLDTSTTTSSTTTSTATASASVPSPVGLGPVGVNQFVTPSAKELEEIARVLAQQEWIQTSDFVPSAKVPVVKLSLANCSLRMDISIENAHTRRGIQATNVVKKYVENFPVVSAMVLVIKQSLREKGLNNAFTGGLSSYAVVLLCVHLLRRKAMLHASHADAGQLIMDFFEYYGMMFDYTTTGISFTTGEYLLPHLLLHPAVAGSGLVQHALMPQLVLDDPVYPDGNHNVGAGTYALARVISAFENVFYALSFHRPTKFTPTPLSQLIHWSGHATTNEGWPSSTSS